jgi:hypothetical protein
MGWDPVVLMLQDNVRTRQETAAPAHVVVIPTASRGSKGRAPVEFPSSPGSPHIRSACVE